MKTTLSVIKADIGGYPGHVDVHPRLIETAKKELHEAKESGLLKDYHVTKCGDDLQLIMTHHKGNDNEEVHELAWDTFIAGTAVSHEMKLYAAGQDMLADSFSGNVKGMGPGVAEMTFEERKSEPVIVFAADKTSPGAWNMPLYKIFADPFNTIGLVIDGSMKGGFEFEVHDIKEKKKIRLSAPAELYELLLLIGSPSKYVVHSVYRKSDGEQASASSTQKLYEVAGRYVGKDDPVLIVRCQSGFPAVGEALEAFAFPALVPGWMRGSHHGPLMPTSVHKSKPTRFDGPPRVIALGFQLANGMLHGPADLFDDESFDHTRKMAGEASEYMRRHGAFEPHRLHLSEMEYTTMPDVMKHMKDRFQAI